MFRAIGPGKTRALLVVSVAVAAILGYQAATHWSLTSGPPAAWGPLLAATPVVLVVVWIAARERRFGLLGVLLLLIAILVVLAMQRAALTLLYLLPHVLAYGLLLWMFGRTLRAGRQPLCTVLARKVHGELPAEIELYTRRVTILWTAFFAAMLAVSIALFAFAPLPIWSLFANLSNLPLIVALFVGEYAYRVWRFPTFSHASFLTAVRLFRQYGLAAVSPNRGH